MKSLQNLLVNYKVKKDYTNDLFIGDLNVEALKQNAEYEWLLNQAYVIIKDLPKSEVIDTWLNNYEQS